MSPDEQTPQTGTTTQNSADFFQSIGSRAQALASDSPSSPAAEKTAGETNVDEANVDASEAPPVEEIESLCMNCGKNGITRLLLTSIPYFRQIVIMSFACDHCHTQNNEIQAAGTIQPKGTHYELRLTALDDLSRQVVKSDTATVKFIELDLEIPAGRGQLTNVEGLLSTVIHDLQLGQEARKEQMPELHDKLAAVIAKGTAMLAGQAFPFRLYVDDPAGNSFIAPDPQDGVGKWEKREFFRTPQQNAALGLSAADADTDAGADANAPPQNPGLTAEGDIIPNEVYSFPASCPACARPCTTNMKMVDIPHFKQVVLMSTVCDDCGYRSNEVKTGGEIPDRGEKITLAVSEPADLARDILKSETCALACPELELQVNPGTLGGRFTTVEGLLTQVRNDLHGQIFEASDSLGPDQRSRWQAFFARLDAAIAGRLPFTLVLSDPLASSYVQPLADDKISKETYERSADEEDDLGLRDMKTEGYQDADADTDADAKTNPVASNPVESTSP